MSHRSIARLTALVLILTFALCIGLLGAIAGAVGGGSGEAVDKGLTAVSCSAEKVSPNPDCSAVGGLGPVGSGPIPTSPVTLPADLSPQLHLVLDYSLAQLGKPYVWGAAGPDSFDCSGLVQAAFAQAGLSLPRTTYDQVTVGTPIYVASQAEAGDLLFFAGSDPGPGGAPGHVGIYLGGGYMVHAPQTGDVVRTTSVAWSDVVAIRREIP